MSTPADPQVPNEGPTFPGGAPNRTADPSLGNDPKGDGSSPAAGDPARHLGPGAVTADPDQPARPAGAPDGGREGEGGHATTNVPTTPGTAQGGAQSQGTLPNGAPTDSELDGGKGDGTSPKPEPIRDRPATVTDDPDNPAIAHGSNTPPTTHRPVTGGQ